MVPDGWFGDEEIIVTDFGDVPVGDADGEGEAVGADEPVDEGSACVAREVHPPPRRWAAARLVARDLAKVETLIERTGAVDARAGAAIMAGLIDVIDRADESTRDRLIDAAVKWPDHGVRRAGIELVAARDGAEAAHDLAARDPNARIRDRAPSSLAERIDDADADQSQPLRTRRDDQLSGRSLRRSRSTSMPSGPAWWSSTSTWS